MTLRPWDLARAPPGLLVGAVPSGTAEASLGDVCLVWGRFVLYTGIPWTSLLLKKLILLTR